MVQHNVERTPQITVVINREYNENTLVHGTAAWQAVTVEISSTAKRLSLYHQ
nr:hypothetical protein [Evansella caseinilytica]